LGSHTYVTGGIYPIQVVVNQNWQASAGGEVIFGMGWLPWRQKLVGPKVVPGNSTFTYQITNLPADAHDLGWTWLYTGFNHGGINPVRASKELAGGKQIVISFKNIPSRLHFTVNYLYDGNAVNSAFGYIDVISVAVFSNRTPAFKTSTPSDAGARTVLGVPMKSVRSSALPNIPGPRPNVPPGMEWSSLVILAGPDNNENVGHIRFGFIQYVYFNAKSGVYAGGNRRVGDMQGNLYLDSEGSIKPWYPAETPKGQFFEVSPENNSKVISSSDNPEFGVPWDYEQVWPGNPGVNAGALHYLQKMNILATFYTWVAAQTIDAPSDFWGEAYGKWSFNTSGTLKQIQTPPDPRTNMFSLAWTGDNAAGVYPPQGWSGIGYPFPLKTALPLTNDALNQERFR